MVLVITPGLTAAVFILIVIIAIIIAWKVEPGLFEETRIRVFIVCLAGLGIALTFLFNYSVVVLQGQQQELTMLQQTTTLSSDLVNGIYDEIIRATPVVPEFVMSLIPLRVCPSDELAIVEPKLQKIVDQPTCNHSRNRKAQFTGEQVYTPGSCAAVSAHNARHRLNDFELATCSPEAYSEITVLSSKIFELWQQVILYGNTVDITPLAYVTNFLQYANSVQLYQVWVNRKINYNQETQKFGDLLFCYGLRVSPQTPEAYVAAAEQLLADPRCLASEGNL